MSGRGDVYFDRPIDIEGDPERTEYDLDPLNEAAIQIDPIEIQGEVPPIHKTPPPLGSVTVENDPLPDGTYRIPADDYADSQQAAAWRHMDEGGLAGFSDELRGALSAANPFSDDGYVEGRDQHRAELAESEARWPDVADRSRLVGVAATLPAMAAAPTAGTVGLRVAQGIVEGAGLGALSAAGHSEADLMSGEGGQWSRLLEDAGEGAGAGAVMGLAGAGIGEGARVVARGARRAAVRQLGEMAPAPNASRAAGAADVAADAAGALDDVAEQMGEGIADASRATRRAHQAARRGMKGAEELAPWLEEIADASEAERRGIGPRLARLAGSGGEGLAERQALRAARSGEPVNFGTLEGVRRRLAQALLESPTPALSRLHDDVADALSSAAESQGLGARYWDAVHAQQLSLLKGARSGPMSLARNALTGAAQGAAVEAGYDLLRGETPDVPSTGALLGGMARAAGGSPRVRVAAPRAAGRALEGVSRGAPIGARVLAGPAGALAAGVGEDGESLDDLAVPNPEVPTASLDDLKDLDVPNPDAPTASLDDLDL